MRFDKTITPKELLVKSPFIYEVVGSYYPFFLKRKDEEYWSYNGIVEITNLIDSNIVNEVNLKKNWDEKIGLQLQNKLNLKVRGATLGLVPNYGGIVELVEKNNGLAVELHFYVSFLVNIYSIQIVYLRDDMVVERPQSFLEPIVTKGIEKLVISPVEYEFYNEFKLVESFIEANFNNPIFLPFALEKLRLKGLEVTYKDEENCMIGDAFFHKAFPINYGLGNIPNIIGDENYKGER